MIYELEEQLYEVKDEYEIEMEGGYDHLGWYKLETEKAYWSMMKNQTK